MKKTSITISYDEEKTNALRLYLEQRGTQIEAELSKALDTLYLKYVPANVRDFIGMRAGAAPSPKPPRRVKTSPPSAAGVNGQEVPSDG